MCRQRTQEPPRPSAFRSINEAEAEANARVHAQTGGERKLTNAELRETALDVINKTTAASKVLTEQVIRVADLGFKSIQALGEYIGDAEVVGAAILLDRELEDQERRMMAAFNKVQV